MEAQAQNQACQNQQFQAIQQEKNAQQDINAVQNQLFQQTEKVRYVLKQKENEALQREAVQLQETMRQLELDQMEFQQQARRLKEEVNLLKKQGE